MVRSAVQQELRQTTALEPRSQALRAVFGVLSTLFLIGSLGAFFVLVIATPRCNDDCSGLLFATLGGVACLPFLLSKALHRYKMPLWRGHAAHADCVSRAASGERHDCADLVPEDAQ